MIDGKKCLPPPLYPHTKPGLKPLEQNEKMKRNSVSQFDSVIESDGQENK